LYVDSHCHLDFPELGSQIDAVLDRMRANAVDRALCVSVTLEDFPRVLALAQAHPNLYASVGVHPDYPDTLEPDVETLVRLAREPKVIATGETHTLQADTVLKAIGQRLGNPVLAQAGLLLQDGRIATDAAGQTNLPGVWAGGDCRAGGLDLTVEAVEHGKQSAHAIHQHLSA
jgi:thioredoxin reductase